MALQGLYSHFCLMRCAILWYSCARVAREYETTHAMDLQSFFDSSLPYLRHPEVKQWGETLAETRQR